jgi:ribosomal protein S1
MENILCIMEPRDLLDKYAVGQRLRGRVEIRAAFGVFVEVARGEGWLVDALVMFDRGPDPGPASRLRVGDTVEVIVTEVDHLCKKLKAVLAPPGPAEPGATPEPGRT